MAFERGMVVELLRPMWVDGEMMEKGDLVEMSMSDARILKANGTGREPQERAGKRVRKGRDQ